MIRIAICDDEEKFARPLKEFVKKSMAEYGQTPDLLVYTDGRMLAADIEEGLWCDLLLLDIEMPKLEGMELAARIRGRLPEALIFFVTSHTEYAVKAYELSIFRYIPKTELESCLPLALGDACRILERRTGECYLIESPRRIEKIPIDRVVYVCKKQKYSVIVWNRADQTREEVPVRKPLGQIREEFNREEFLLVERGYLVNLYHVERMEDGQILMDSGDLLPVSRGRAREVREQIGRFWRERL